MNIYERISEKLAKAKNRFNDLAIRWFACVTTERDNLSNMRRNLHTDGDMATKQKIEYNK